MISVDQKAELGGAGLLIELRLHQLRKPVDLPGIGAFSAGRSTEQGKRWQEQPEEDMQQLKTLEPHF